MVYAADTSVSADRSRSELEGILVRYGADQFMYGWDGPRAVVRFRANDRYVHFELPMPDRDDFASSPAGRRRTAAQAEKAYEQAIRSRWRSLVLVVKAKLEAVESGIVGFEEEFLAHLVLPEGMTVGQWISPQIATAYETGQMPGLLPETTGER